MTTTDKNQKHAQNDLITATKEIVTTQKAWTTNIRDAAWAPWLTIADQHETASSVIKPWYEMTRTAQDRWLEMYETQAHQIIERSAGLADTFKR